jgi:hypothetical protein
MSKNDSAFYTWGDCETIERVGNLNVCVNGEMHVIYTDPSGTEHIIRNAKQLEEAGIVDDQDLYYADDQGRLEWENNSWFEVFADEADTGEVFHNLEEAIAFAKSQQEETK